MGIGHQKPRHDKDNRLFRSQFVKYLNDPEETDQNSAKYEAILAQIQQLLAPGQATNENVDLAWKLLFEAAKYRADSQLCNDIADSVYALWQCKSEQSHLATANDSIRSEEKDIAWNMEQSVSEDNHRTFPTKRYWAISIMVCGMLVGLPFVLRTRSLPVHAWNHGNIVILGSGKPVVAVLSPSKEVLGKFYGQEIRKNSPGNGSVVIVSKSDVQAASNVADCSIYIVSGGDENALSKWSPIVSPRSNTTLVLINCRIPPNDWIKGFGRVIYCHGDFYGDPHYGEWKDLSGTNSAVSVKDIPRHAAYIADWWSLLNEATAK